MQETKQNKISLDYINQRNIFSNFLNQSQIKSFPFQNFLTLTRKTPLYWDISLAFYILMLTFFKK